MLTIHPAFYYCARSCGVENTGRCIEICLLRRLLVVQLMLFAGTIPQGATSALTTPAPTAVQKSRCPFTVLVVKEPFADVSVEYVMPFSINVHTAFFKHPWIRNHSVQTPGYLNDDKLRC